MEKFFTLEYGVGGLCVMIFLSALARIGEFLWRVKEKRESISESSITKLTDVVSENTLVTRHLDVRIQCLEKTISEFPQFKTDIRRFYAAIRQLAGEEWPSIRDGILKDDFIL